MVEEALQQKSKEKFYRGNKISNLKNMDTREFSKFVKARPRRSLLRNYDIIESFVKKCEERESKNKPIRTHNRALVIVPALLGKTIGIHNGKEYIRVNIIEEMLGHRLGEFSPTRKPTKHGAAGVGATKSTASKSVK
jgi:small subunit ribosomal protein S19|tara:strand:+ start:692 stop:1102 length:411 start_codon:yes stop_codon:yes gene_type:complete